MLNNVVMCRPQFQPIQLTYVINYIIVGHLDIK